MTAETRAAEVLAEHAPHTNARGADGRPVTVACSCGPGWSVDKHPTYREHVAAALSAALKPTKEMPMPNPRTHITTSGSTCWCDPTVERVPPHPQWSRGFADAMRHAREAAADYYDADEEPDAAAYLRSFVADTLHPECEEEL